MPFFRAILTFLMNYLHYQHLPLFLQPQKSGDSFSQCIHEFEILPSGSILRADFIYTGSFLHAAQHFLQRGQLQTFRCVLANPPFSLKNWGAEQFSSDIYGRNAWGTPTNSNGDFAWLQHMVASMDKNNWRLAVVLPQGVLFRGGKEGGIRKQLIESDKLEYVITLLGGVFYSSGVSVCILILSNNKPESHKGKVCFVDASNIYTPQRAQNIMTEDNIMEVYSLCANYADVTEKARVATINDIRDKNYTLSVSSYIAKAARESISPREVREQFSAALSQALSAEENLKTLLAERGYLHE